MSIVPSYWTNYWNLHKELNWAEAIIRGRLKLGQRSKSYELEHGSYLECELLPNIEDEKYIIEVSSLFGNQKRKAVISFVEPEIQSEYPNLNVFFFEDSYLLISQQNDWVELAGIVTSVFKKADNSYQIIESKTKRAWIPINLTTIPVIYSEINTCADFEERLAKLDATWLKRIGRHILGCEQKRLTSSIVETGKIESALPPSPFPDEQSVAGIISENDLHFYDRLLLALVLMPHIFPEKLDAIFMEEDSRIDKCVGGLKGQSSGVFLPTAQTFLFLVAGFDAHDRTRGYDWLCHRSLLIQNDVVSIQPTAVGDVYLSGVLSINEYYLQLLITGNASVEKPKE